MKFLSVVFLFSALTASASVKTGEYSGSELWNLLNSQIKELTNPHCVVRGLRTYDKFDLNLAVGNKLTTITLSDDFLEIPESAGTYKKVVKVEYKFVSSDEQTTETHTIKCLVK